MSTYTDEESYIFGELEDICNLHYDVRKRHSRYIFHDRAEGDMSLDLGPIPGSVYLGPLTGYERAFSIQYFQNPTVCGGSIEFPELCEREHFLPCKDFNAFWLEGVAPRTLPSAFLQFPPMLDVNNFRICAYQGLESSRHSTDPCIVVFGYFIYEQKGDKVILCRVEESRKNGIYQRCLDNMKIECDIQKGTGMRFFSRAREQKANRPDEEFSVFLPSRFITLLKSKTKLEEDLKLWHGMPATV